MSSIGICMGAASITAVEISKGRINDFYRITHEGDVRRSLQKLMQDNGLLNEDYYAVTGRKFKSMVDLPSIAEAEAVELAYGHVAEKNGAVDAVVSAGAETFLAYELNERGKIKNVYTGNKCASGTGEFFLQQIKRMNLDLEEAMDLARTDDPYLVSGRCSVFCKSDCTHALNKGEDKGRITGGLCRMMAEKILELLNNCQARKIMLVGGTSQNNIMVEYLQKQLDEVIIPDEACYFESLGTALWASENGAPAQKDQLLVKEQDSFDSLPQLSDYRDQVKFYDMEKGEITQEGERCILGLDVGSTTTKAVLIKEEDNSLIDSVYLRTSGDPVDASRRCYRELHSRLKDKNFHIVGLGVTGSGRKIAGLHALTDSVINEIIAHAEGAVYFDEDVDTIFEIGGQDAKYTYLVNKVPTDYAMNEACSAGTGSFLEESAEESLNIAMEDIADIALQGGNPPNFSDQCAAFISSDIKNAIQEGYEIEDICAGLVYSICMNYKNRVKGSRPIGEKVFMQGGVCYNRAVPMAMAALTGKEIIVPPEPGLMGAFGVALVVKEHLKLGLVDEAEFDLKELADREVKRENSFVCAGGDEGCDRKCKINVLNIEGEKYPFGGICNKYANINRDVEYDIQKLDLVRRRQKMLYEDYFYHPESNEQIKGQVGINRSLMTNQLLPLYSRFFAELGYEVVLPEEISEKGVQKLSSAFCYPVEISHGYMDNLIKEDPDYIFLPHIKGLYVENSPDTSILCPMAQSEPYYLQATWDELQKDHVFTPVLDFQKGYSEVKEDFIKTAVQMGSSRNAAEAAFQKALKAQKEFKKALENKGQEVLAELEKDPESKAVVAFGRPYNAFADEANMGIPHKFSSQGEMIIPFDMLPLDDKKKYNKMYWSMGQILLRAADFVSEHPQLFGLFITNFSCGPDSFLVSYFRRKNGRKPTLTLQLDSHTADAGLNTRIEAFLDVVDSYRELIREGYDIEPDSEFQPLRVEDEEAPLKIIDENNREYDLTDDRVQILIPSMGSSLTSALQAALEYEGINVKTCPRPGEKELNLGRSNATGKECLPLLLTLGSLLRYIEEEKEDDSLLVYFMPEASGPCRFGQYNVLMKNLIEDKEIKNVGIMSLTSTNGYAGLSMSCRRRAWRSLIMADIFNEIHSSVLALSKNPRQAEEIYDDVRAEVFNSLKQDSPRRVQEVMKQQAARLTDIEVETPLEKAPKVGLTGEVYVRNDEFSRQFLVEKLAEKGIITRVSPFNEWLHYIDYLLKSKMLDPQPSFMQRIKVQLESTYKKKVERDVKKIWAETDLYEYRVTDVEEIIAATDDLMSEELTGETVLTIGASVEEIIEEVHGMIAIGPFGCMPNRVSESIITDTLEEQKRKISDDELTSQVLDEFSSLPFLAIETDGNPFPQVIEARLEAFCLQVQRISDYINSLEEEKQTAGDRI